MSGIVDRLDKLLQDIDRQSMLLEEIAADMKAMTRDMARLLNDK